MARKNARISDNYDSGVLFDTCTKTVMAYASTDGIKEKVQAVREVVPGRSNNDIVLVLQYYDYSVEQTIQAFLETGAIEALGEWHMLGNKPNNKKKKSKSKSSANGGGSANQNSSALPPDDKAHHPDSQGTEAVTGKQSSVTAQPAATSSKLNAASSADITASVGANTNRNNPLLNDQPSMSQVSSTNSSTSTTMHQGSQFDSSPATDPHSSNVAVTPVVSELPAAKQPAATTMPATAGASNATSTNQRAQPSQNPIQKAVDTNSDVRNSRERTTTERSNMSVNSVSSATALEKPRRPNAGLEKSLKDLQRQTVSLQRLKHVIETELDKSSRTITEFFEQIRQRVNEREETVVTEMAKVKIQAYDTLEMRQGRAKELRQSTIRAPTMNDAELADLRADIKVFVGDRKMDEELGGTTRFVGDIDHMTKEIQNFGTVVPVNIFYNHRRPSTPIDVVPRVAVPPVQRPSVPAFQSRETTQHTQTHNTTDTHTSSNMPHPMADKVICQSDSVTKYEITELQHQPSTTSSHAPSTTDSYAPSTTTAHESMFRRRGGPTPYVGRGGNYGQGNWRGARRGGGGGRGGDRYSAPDVMGGGGGRGGDRYSAPDVMEPPVGAMDGHSEGTASRKTRRRQKKREGEKEQRQQMQSNKPSEERRGGQWGDSSNNTSRPRQHPGAAPPNHFAKMNGGVSGHHHESNGGDGIMRGQGHRGYDNRGSRSMVNGSHYQAAVPHHSEPIRPAKEINSESKNRRPPIQSPVSLASGDNGIIPLTVHGGDFENNNKHSGGGGPTRATVSVQGGKVLHDSMHGHKEALPQRESRKRRNVKTADDIPVANGDANVNGIDQ